MTGTVEVFLYNEENGQREDLTESLGNRHFNLYEHKFELIQTIKMVYSHPHLVNKYISFYTLEDISPSMLPKFFMDDYIYTMKTGIEHIFSSNYLSCDIEEHNKKLTYGKDYEEYISNKYIQNGYSVENRGIKKSFNDGGLDIVAKKNNTLVLVQCKNWSMSNIYKINQKDIRAFIGDCLFIS